MPVVLCLSGMNMWFLFTLLVVILLFLFPRPMAIVLGVGAVVGAVAGGFYYFQTRDMAAQLKAVDVAVAYDPAQCTETEPLLITVSNGSDYTVSRVDWVFSARRPGYRSEMTGAWLKPQMMEESVAPGSQWVGCYRAPTPPAHAVQRQADHPSNLLIGIRERQVSFAGQ